ncbi:AN1-type zinc finger protein 1-like [Periplaneta americana]|uniref:AN1-type zinc finger protein 1-like n=1 Tax=Periplaneta americana TaxID=6978 RepID=UPI0037E8014A
MELPELGKRCAVLECKQLDFLPFICTHCQIIFCKEHYMPDKHACIQDTAESNKEVTEPVKQYSCNHEGCSTLNPVEMCCPVCKRHFCLQHRHHGCIDKAQATRDKEREKWEAPRKQFELAKAETDRQVDASLNRAMKKGSLNKTALKVQLMRLKGKAVGSKGIPTTDRVYFLVYSPLTVPQKSKAVFVAKQWSVGRVIDSVADACNVPNRNNENIAKKLRIFHQHNGQIVCIEMERKLEELLKDGLVNDGETLILEYITDNDSDSHNLKNLELYKD